MDTERHRTSLGLAVAAVLIPGALASLETALAPLLYPYPRLQLLGGEPNIKVLWTMFDLVQRGIVFLNEPELFLEHCLGIRACEKDREFEALPFALMLSETILWFLNCCANVYWYPFLIPCIHRVRSIGHTTSQIKGSLMSSQEGRRM
jgi:hypothetical protein